MKSIESSHKVLTSSIEGAVQMLKETFYWFHNVDTPQINYSRSLKQMCSSFYWIVTIYKSI